MQFYDLVTAPRPGRHPVLRTGPDNPTECGPCPRRWSRPLRFALLPLRLLHQPSPALTPVSSLRSLSQAAARYRRAVQQLLHLLGRLGRAACEALAPEEAAGVAAAALNHVCGQLVAAVLAKGCVGGRGAVGHEQGNGQGS